VTLPRSSVQLIIAAVAWCGDYGRPTLFKIAIACGFKLTLKKSQIKIHAAENISKNETMK
jgi:hypothetical protein